MVRRAKNITAVQLKLQALLEVMGVATDNVSETKRAAIYWGGLYGLAQELVERTLSDSAELEDFFDDAEGLESI